MKNLIYLCMAFFCCLTVYAQTDTKSKSNIQRVRIDFKTPEGFVRHLLLAFTKDNSASDAIDYGYDARNRDKLSDDLNWLIDSQRFVIQGVGAYNELKRYPFGMFMSNSGPIEISLTALEHFDTPIPVFIYDAWRETYHKINEVSYKNTIDSGVYTDRFFIAFSNNKSYQILSNQDNSLNEVSLNYFRNSKTLNIKTQGIPLQLKLYTLQGQLISSHDLNHTTETHALSMAHLQNQVVLTVLESDQNYRHNRILIN
ncbi:hypothetical protein [Gelidibacter maritimus]|uniref:T9SS type A sorting domain-containing protein n=1 Tax=Gelidibacter maritimus TaxID=2761487 RepID=A0A7W2R5A7_9FLAO|nr:hypothetical protein [Gelidibacter maritimus]MBA6154722.1 hypothetical protein [Gelidibacter maritimus]